METGRLLRGFGQGGQLGLGGEEQARGPEGAKAQGGQLGAESVGLALRGALHEPLVLKGTQ